MTRSFRGHIDNPPAVGRRLREARERAGLSQRQLSFPGCSSPHISRIEAGDRVPSLQLLNELGRRLGVSGEWIASGTRGGAQPTRPSPRSRELKKAIAAFERARVGYERAVEKLLSELKERP